MRIARESACAGAVLALLAVVVVPACSSFGSSPPEPATDAAASTDGSVQGPDAGPVSFEIGCGKATCGGPASFCCFPPGGSIDTAPTCASMPSACTGDNVAVYCDEPSDCPPTSTCCVTMLDSYRMGPATCRKSCGEGDAGSNDIRICNPKTTVSQNGCLQGDCVSLRQANTAITGGPDIQIDSGLFGCSAN